MSATKNHYYDKIERELRQGRRPEQAQRNANIARFSTVILFAIIVLLLIARNCHADEVGYLVSVRQYPEKTKIYKVRTPEAANAIIARYNASTISASRPAVEIYVEQKRIVHKNGKTIWKRQKPNKPVIKHQ